MVHDKFKPQKMSQLSLLVIGNDESSLVTCKSTEKATGSIENATGSIEKATE